MDAKKNTTILVGILGAGRIGKVHANNIASMRNAAIKYISDPYINDETRDWIASLRGPIATTDADCVINDPEIDAIIICSPTDTHTNYIIKAADAKKHIFCEKPIALDASSTVKALAAVERAGVKLQVGFVRRFDHNHRKIRDYVVDGRIGEPHIVKITSRDPERPPMEYVKTSGGIFADMMIHDFDMAYYLAGCEVEEVYAAGSALIDAQFAEYGDVDTAAVTLKFANGALGCIDNSRETLYGYDQRTEVFGSKGCAIVTNDMPNTCLLTSADGVRGDKPLWFFLERYNDAFIAEMASFFDAVSNDTEPLVTGCDALRSIRIAMAAKRSLKEGRPVKISEID